MASPSRLSADAIYDLLDSSWWVTATVIAGQLNPSTMLYYATESGQYGSFMSVGDLDYMRELDVPSYVEDYLMWEAARQLANGGCTGSITNILPKTFVANPIYPR